MSYFRIDCPTLHSFGCNVVQEVPLWKVGGDYSRTVCEVKLVCVGTKKETRTKISTTMMRV